MTYRSKEIAAIAEIFLSDAFEPESWVSKDLTKEERQQRLLIEGKKAETRNDKIMEILGGEGLDASSVLWLFNELELKAMNKLSLIAALPQAKRLELLRKHLPDFLIESSENAERSRNARRSAKANYETNTKEHLARKEWKDGMTKKESIAFKKHIAGKHSVTERQVGNWIEKWKSLSGFPF
ncbi:hypothetical protein J9253_15485 [Thiothrix litoralis]|uniref:Uncharacterized protein n=1 Tax=Thiothrix litoralis TaxID=2891210 RepID=A0ABX7WPI9_9GAMM|nr:hypothetical protein [Thiothrix litoralis]QTR45395.1 hypothetical protein J9253_15485 [Thiothrix litoralis]